MGKSKVDDVAHGGPGQCLPVAECRRGEMVRLRGSLRTLTLQPRGGVPFLEAELRDEAGDALDIIFMGRRQIPGIVPGREVIVEGRLTSDEGRRTMYNPRYELLS